MLQTERHGDDGPSLVFHDGEGAPVRCDGELFKACPFKVSSDRTPLDSRGTAACRWCGGRHRPGSLNAELCREWHLFKEAHHDNQRAMPGRRKYFLHGSRQPVYSDRCDETLRRHLWPRVKLTVLRRDGFTCQDCGHRGRTWSDGRWRGLEVHHIVPRILGGTDHPANLKCLCPHCHRSYTAMGAKDWARSRALDKVATEAMRLIILEDDPLDDDLFDLERG